MMVCFVSDQKPLSVQSKNKMRSGGYRQRLIQEFYNQRASFPDLPITETIYSKVIYVHSKASTLDVDNMSKPIIDAFKGIIYADDYMINHRICSKIKFDDFEAYEFQLDLLPIEIVEKLDRLISEKSPHIVYFEVGLFSPDMVRFGGVQNEA